MINFAHVLSAFIVHITLYAVRRGIIKTTRAKTFDRLFIIIQA